MMAGEAVAWTSARTAQAPIHLELAFFAASRVLRFRAGNSAPRTYMYNAASSSPDEARLRFFRGAAKPSARSRSPNSRS